MAQQSSAPDPDPAPDGTSLAAVPAMRTGQAAVILGVTARTVERWIDDQKLRGGRPTSADGVPVKGSHRWVDALHVVELAIGARREAYVPQSLAHLARASRQTDPTHPIPSDGV